MLVEAGAALGSIKTALDMVKGVRALKSEVEINQAVIDIQRTLLEAQSAAIDDKERQMGLLARVADLEAKVAQQGEWEIDRRRYRLTEFSTGRFAHELIDTAAAGDPPHKLCAKCFTEGRKSILQTIAKRDGGESVHCQHCKETMILTEFPPDPIITVGRSRYEELNDYF